jgi:outer membrane protein assembly factor BamA
MTTAALALAWVLLAEFPTTGLFAQNPAASTVLEGSRIEQILVVGLNRVREPVVLRQLKSQVGGLYSVSNVASDRERLDRMGLFSGIDIEASPGSSGVILHVNLKETSPYFVYPAISVTGEQGLTLGAGLKSTNLLGTGANASIAARGGGAIEFEVLIASAWRPKGSWWWKSDFFLKDRFNSLDNFNEVSNELELQAGRQVANRLRIGGRFHFLAVKSDEPGITLSPTNLDQIPGLGAVVEYDSRDSWTHARNGWWSSVDALSNRLAADEKYWTFNVDIRRYQHISGPHGLAMNSLLTLQTGTVGTEIPIHEDFHIGGTNSLRGWNIDARHGKDQFLNTLEYRFDLLKVNDHSFKGFNYYYGVQLAAFADTGTAWDTNEEFTRNFIAGGGFGIRLIVPYVSVIRIDFGFGQANQGMISHFGIMEKAVYERRRVR